MADLRLFISVPLNAPTLTAAISSFQQQLDFPGIKLVKPDLFHFSLHFLGDTDAQLVPKLEEAFVGIKEAPFTVTLDQAGVFPSLQNIKVLWVGVSNGSDSLQSLHQQFKNPLEELGFHIDTRPYTPHVTIGRVKFLNPNHKSSVQQAIRTHKNTTFGTQEVSSIHLMQSTLTPQGPIYQPIISQDLSD